MEAKGNGDIQLALKLQWNDGLRIGKWNDTLWTKFYHTYNVYVNLIFSHKRLESIKIVNSLNLHKNIKYF